MKLICENKKAKLYYDNAEKKYILKCQDDYDRDNLKSPNRRLMLKYFEQVDEKFKFKSFNSYEDKKEKFSIKNHERTSREGK